MPAIRCIPRWYLFDYLNRQMEAQAFIGGDESVKRCQPGDGPQAARHGGPKYWRIHEGIRGATMEVCWQLRLERRDCLPNLYQ